MSRKCFELAEQATATTGRRATHRLVGRRVNVPAAFRGRSTGTRRAKPPRGIRAAFAITVARVFSAVRCRARGSALSRSSRPRGPIRRHRCHRGRVDRGSARGFGARDSVFRTRSRFSHDAAPHRVQIIRIVYIYDDVHVFPSLSVALIPRDRPSLPFSLSFSLTSRTHRPRVRCATAVSAVGTFP